MRNRIYLERLTGQTATKLLRCFALVGASLITPFNPMQGASTAERAPISPEWSDTEKWVISRLQERTDADLDEMPGVNDAKRTISARFLEKLLTDTLPGTKPLHQNVHLLGAVFVQPIKLDGVEVSCEVWLDRCRFTEPVSFEEARFAKTVTFDRSTFVCRASFSGIKVDGRMGFNKSTFAGPAIFTDANFCGNFEAWKAHFNDEIEGVDFAGMKVGKNFMIHAATFAGPARFTDTKIAGSFIADKARFHSEDGLASFEGMEIAESANFYKASFAGPVVFIHAAFAGNLSADEMHCNNPVQEADFGDVKVTDNLFIRDAVFAGPAAFTNANILGWLLADGARFTDVVHGAAFDGIKVGGRASFGKTTFAGPTNFLQATVGGNLVAQGAVFENKDAKVMFGDMKVGGFASFHDALFRGPVTFASSDFLDLILDQTTSRAEPTPLFDLTDTAVRRSLNMSRCHAEVVSAELLHVGNAASLTEMQVEQIADFSYCDFTALALVGSKWPTKQSHGLKLQSTTYKHILADGDPITSHAKLIKLADQAVYSSDVYSALEAFFTREGYRDDADSAYVTGRWREWKEYPHRLSPRYYWSWLISWVGYGRYPWWAFVPCVFFVGVGCFLFAPEKMEEQGGKIGSPWMQHPTVYHRFWYSLELFLPIVKLEAEDAWTPKHKYRFLRHYMRVHTLLGWILVPIALAVITGLIK